MNTTTSHHADRPIALITGGSRGIGLALARQFLQHDHDLILVARDETTLARAAEDLEREYPGRAVTPISLDLSVADAPAELFRRLKAKGIQIDVLVNNAGVGDYGPFAESDPDRLSAMMRLNMQAPTELIRRFLPAMIARGSGRILNVASLTAFFSGGANWSSYVASKHYMLAFSRGLRGELAGSGVSVTALCPGPVATDFVQRSAVGGTRVYRWLSKLDPDAVARRACRAAMAGRAVVVPGGVNKLLAFLGELPPRGIARTVFAFLLRGNASGETLPERVA